jgi:hypothetical protein
MLSVNSQLFWKTFSCLRGLFARHALPIIAIIVAGLSAFFAHSALNNAELVMKRAHQIETCLVLAESADVAVKKIQSLNALRVKQNEDVLKIDDMSGNSFERRDAEKSIEELSRAVQRVKVIFPSEFREEVNGLQTEVETALQKNWEVMLGANKDIEMNYKPLREASDVVIYHCASYAKIQSNGK